MSRCLCLLVAALALLGGCALPKEKLPAPPGAAPTAASGGTLSVGITPPSGVDPLSFSEPSGMLIGSVLCDTLVTLDPETGDVKPGLARKWTVTDDGGRIIIQLRKDVYFHDGREMKSADVADSLKRLANPEFASYATDLMDAVFGIERFRSDVEEGLPSPDLTGVRIIEPYSFELFLRPKNPDFIRALAHPATAPVSKAPYDADADSAPAHPQCAGPYRLEAPFRVGAPEIVLRKWERYHGQDSTHTARGAGYADELRFRVHPDAEAVYQAYARGQVDVAGVPAPRAAEAQQRFGSRVVGSDSPHEEFIALPHGAGSAFADRNARVALSQALNREALARDVYGGAYAPATGFIPPALTTQLGSRPGKGSSRQITFGCGETVPLAGDPEAARRAWAEVKEPVAHDAESVRATPAAPTGVPAEAPGGAAALPGSGSPWKLYFNDEGNHRKLAESVAAQWRDVLGVTFELVPLSWDAFVQKGTLGSGFDGAFRMSHSPRYSSPQAFLGPLFLGSHSSRTNLARYSNHAFETAYEEDTRPEVDEQERRLRYRELEDLLCDDVPIVPIAFGRRYVAVGERVVPARQSGRLLSREGVPLLRDMAVAH